MSKINMKITTVLLVYALLVTGIFVGGILSFASYSNNDRVQAYMDSNLMEKDPASNEEVIGNPNQETDTKRLQDLQKYSDFYREELMKRIAVIAIFFCAFLITSSFILWIILKKIQQKENLRIAAQLHSIQEMHDFASDDPVLAKAFSSIKEEFEHHIADYKRLHTYLSHEQKNALSLLRANLELHHEEACLKNIEELTMGIDDLVTLSENREENQLQPVDIIMLCAEVVDRYIPHYPQLQFDFDEDTLYVCAKPRWISSALHNLIDNAIKYGEEKPVHVLIEKDADTVLIHVQDHGIGIAEDQQEKIFQQNYRINELHKDGYGIGLSLVMHVCKLCEGRITCVSKRMEGSTFTLCLPLYYKD
ncbi:HAMP domain-containing histidine kinase [[Clostridium] innocuum]|nr:HAMP domain-containing histidine kinase [Erysipelotrichaceae bacterium]MCR0411317.1 HAMP domain-containing histidine kinase [[Clostridium] innocuum]MCR0534901.1 HAMP domain-containing histidine kinase [[Clostridium] innocuum]MCR0538870.1 HAMP domain-containing histidine kinase [[Clostridium] innocuum]